MLTIILIGETPRQYATARDAIRALLREVENGDLGAIVLCDVPAESRRRTVGLPGPQGDVGTHAVVGKGGL